MESRERVMIGDATRVVHALRPQREVVAQHGRNNWVFLLDTECVSVPRYPSKTPYAVRVAAMRRLVAAGVPTTPLIEHGVLDGTEYVITRRLNAYPPNLCSLSQQERWLIHAAAGRALGAMHRLTCRRYGRLDNHLRGSHTSWRSFVEDFFGVSLRRLAADRELYARFAKRVEDRFSQDMDLLKGVRPSFLHGDFHLGNILFEGTELRAIVDLDIVMSGDCHWDIGHLLRTSKSSQQHAREAFVEGYGDGFDRSRADYYAMIIWTRKIASQAESRREALAETVAEMERILSA